MKAVAFGVPRCWASKFRELHGQTARKLREAVGDGRFRYIHGNFHYVDGSLPSASTAMATVERGYPDFHCQICVTRASDAVPN